MERELDALVLRHSWRGADLCPDPAHLQLLEKGWLRRWSRGLQMVCKRILATPDEASVDTLGREIVRRQVPKAVFHVFNWTFISFYQCILLYLISAPIYSILLAST